MNFVKISFLVFFCLFAAPQVLAHDEGQPPFVTLNGLPTMHAPITTTSLPDFIRPHDIFDQTFLVNTPVYFAMDPEKLLYEKAVVTGREFHWDLGDGVKHTGTTFAHTYKKVGSYIVSMHAVKPNTDDEILVFRAILQVVPNKDYILPKVVIGLQGKDTSGEVAINFSEPVTLEAHSIEGEAAIVDYFWDLGDGKSSNLPVVVHTYDTFHSEARPILRVRDQNGFIADAVLKITNSDVSAEEFKNEVIDETPATRSRFYPLLVLLPIGIIVALIIYKRRTS